jgi:hypothetical protein
MYTATLAGGVLMGILPGCVEESILNFVTPLFIF